VTAELVDDTAIRTPDQRLRVFVSSTLGELADERGAGRPGDRRPARASTPGLPSPWPAGRDAAVAGG